MKFICLVSFVFCFTFANGFTHVVVVVALSCVCNQPHNQFIITLCIEWMHIVKETHSPAKHTQCIKCSQKTAATCYTSVIERLPQKPFFFNSISLFVLYQLFFCRLLLRCFHFSIPFYTVLWLLSFFSLLLFTCFLPSGYRFILVMSHVRKKISVCIYVIIYACIFLD